ncbi:bluetail domain-containing putative surface protein, partial [Dolichospermum planctonicum]|uniref:bluetail domain-containing putative surface protein n=1 Tax=Dolichospermum planctonicum TaxID=136072 RepID=UPI0010F47A18
LGVSNGYWSNSAFHDYRGSFNWQGTNYANSPLLSFSNIETFEITGTAYADHLRGYSGDDKLIGGEGNDDIAGGDGSDIIKGGDGNDTLKGEGGNDEIEGGDGNDTIDGGTGRHVIRGGTGNDTVVSAKAGDSIDGGEGTDTLQSLDLSSLDVDLVLNLRVTEQVSGDNNTRINNFENISSVTLGSGYDTTIATGNLLVSNGSINAGGGTDRLIVDYSSATFSGLGTNGLGVSNGYWSNSAFHDYRGSFNWQGTNYANSPLLSFSNIETFEITGTAYADYLRGYSGDDKLIGGEGNDDIAGGDGSDTIISVNPNVAKPGLGTVDTVTGGTGEDTFILGDVTWIGYDDYNRTTAGTSDYLIIKDFNPLEDIIQLLGSSSDYTTTVSGNNINLYINKPDSEPDELIAVLENTQGLINPLQFNLSGSYFNYIASNAVLNITGTSSIQTEGNSDQKPFVFTVTRSGDTSGTSTVDWFITPSGNNPVNSTDFFGGAMPPGESLTFLPGETSKEIRVRVRGDSTIESNETFTVYLSTPSRATIGTRSATGIILNDDGSQPTLPVFGTSGNDTLSGTINVDCLIGLAGNDTYTVNNAGDVVVENPSQGTDLVNASISYTLTDNFENLTLTGSANLNGTGNNLNNSLTGNTGNNILTGNAGNDTLNGGAGIDTLIGGLGNDLYVVDSTTDTITENSGEGTDIIQSSVTFDLAVFPNIENLTLTGTAVINGTGNAGNNSLTGNGGNNTLTGNAGNDTLNGGTGNDLLNGGAGADTLTGGIGSDTLVFQFGQSPVSGADRITDFAIGTDKIDLLTSLGVAMNAPTAFTRAANSTATTLTDVVNNVFTDADGALTGNQALGVNSAALVSVTTFGIAGTYLVINDGVAGFQSSNDLLVNITGYSGILPALGTIAVSSFFI